MELESTCPLQKHNILERQTEYRVNDIGNSAPHTGYPSVKLGSGLEPVKVEIIPDEINKLQQENNRPISQNIFQRLNSGNSVDNGANHVKNEPRANQNHNTQNEKFSRLVILAGKCTNKHIIHHLSSLRQGTIPITEVSVTQIAQFPFTSYSHINIYIEYDNTFSTSVEQIYQIFPKIFGSVLEIGFHIIFDGTTKWLEYPEKDRDNYHLFFQKLADLASDKVMQCSVIGKYDSSTVYITEKDDLVRLGREIQEDIAPWANLRVCDYGENCIRFFPGVKFPDSLEVLNIGGGSSLETLAGFKMPPSLKVLDACKGAITSVDYILFPSSLDRLDLLENHIFFLNYVELPPMLQTLDLSHNNIDTLKNITFPRTLLRLSVSNNPIECMKGARFPESIEYLDLSCMPNESMSGVKFPDNTRWLNLQQSMTNTRGLKLPPHVEELNMAGNGVNSITTLRLPHLITKLHLGHNNIKTLNKVIFPSCLRELYLGNNIITTLKNVVFPSTLEILDLDMDSDEETDRNLTTLKDVVFPPLLRVLRLAHHLIRAVEGIDLPFHLQELSLAYNDVRVFRNVRFGPKLAVLDLSGNNELGGMDNVFLPESLVEFRVSPLLVGNLPPAIIERANRRQVRLLKSANE